MAGGQFLNFLHATSRSSLAKPSRSFFYTTNKNYGQPSNGNRSGLMAERAPSTAEEFERVAEEKARERMAIQNAKSYEGAQEATIGDSKTELVKNKLKA